MKMSTTWHSRRTRSRMSPTWYGGTLKNFNCSRLKCLASKDRKNVTMSLNTCFWSTYVLSRIKSQKKGNSSSSQASSENAPSSSGEQVKWLPTSHSQRSYRWCAKNTPRMTSRKYHVIDGIFSKKTPNTNFSLTSSNTSRNEQNKHLTRKQMSMSICLCSASYQSLYKMISASQPNEMQRSTKSTISSGDDINTNNSRKFHSHSPSTKSPQARTNATMNAPPKTTQTNSGNPMVHVSNAIKKAQIFVF